MVISIALSVSAIFFFFSFTGFSTILATNDVVNGEEIFISTDQTAVDGFLETLNFELDKLDPNCSEFDLETDMCPTFKDQALGLILTVVMRDSNGVIVPQEQNFLTIPTPASLLTVDGELLDFAKLQFDFEAVLVKNDRIGEITVDYEMTMNGGTAFLKGTAFGSGTTADNRLNLLFEQGTKRGDAIELDFEKGEVPVKIVTGQSFTNTLDVTVTKVSALVGTDFGTQQYQWTGVFPVYKLKFDADAESRTVRDFRGIAVQTLPNDITISASSTPRLDINNYVGDVDYHWDKTSTTITVTKLDGSFIASTSGGIVGGIPRGETLIFTITGDGAGSWTVTTPDSQRAYTAGCSPHPKSSCTNNFNGIPR